MFLSRGYEIVAKSYFWGKLIQEFKLFFNKTLLTLAHQTKYTYVKNLALLLINNIYLTFSYLEI